MRLIKIAGVITALMGIAAVWFAVAPSVYGQSGRPNDSFNILVGPGSQIGASVRDLEPSEVRGSGGVYVEDVTPNSPADKAGIKHADIITTFDGETVKSVRQFTRLVRETPPDRVVPATIVRDGKSTDLKVTPEAGSRAGVYIGGDRFSVDTDRLQEQLGQLHDRLSRGGLNDFSFGFGPQGFLSGVRLGVTVDELTPQLATYFGVKDGVLVASVETDSPAARAGLKAGDVITAVNGQNVASRGDLVRSIQNARAEADLTIDIMREKKETSVTAKLENTRAMRRPLRPIRQMVSDSPLR